MWAGGAWGVTQAYGKHLRVSVLGRPWVHLGGLTPLCVPACECRCVSASEGRSGYNVCVRKGKCGVVFSYVHQDTGSPHKCATEDVCVPGCVPT